MSRLDKSTPPNSNVLKEEGEGEEVPHCKMEAGEPGEVCVGVVSELDMRLT